MTSKFYDDKDLKFKIGFGMMIAGPSNSGKTSFLLRLIKYYKEMFDPVPQQIVYCYGQYHKYIPILESQGIFTHSGVPTEEFIDKCKKPLLLILDDMAFNIGQKILNDLYTKKNHHQNIGCICITQSLFEKNLKIARDNSQYLVLMRSAVMLPIRNLGVQLFPRQLDYFLSAFSDSTKGPYGYLLVDLHPASDPTLRLRINIFPDDAEKTIYLPK